MFELPPTEGLGSAEAFDDMGTRSLEEITFEPTAFVEGMGEFQQAEALQVSLEAVTASLPGEGVSTLPMPVPRPAEEVSSLPEPIPGSTEGVSSLPVPFPRPTEEASEKLSLGDEGKVEIPEPGSYGGEAMVKEQAGVAEVPAAADRGVETGSTLPLPMPAPFFEEVGTPAIDRLASVEAMPTGMAETAELPTGDARAAASESATKEDFKAGAGSLPRNLPEDSVPLGGIGTGEMVEETSTPFTQGFTTGLPTQDNLDMRPGGEGGSGSSGKVYGNVPGFKGGSYGDSDMPTSGLPGGSKSDFLEAETFVPLPEGPHTSGGGAPVDDPRGRTAGGEDKDGGHVELYIYETDQGTQSDCNEAANRARDMAAMDKASGKTSAFFMECFGVLDDTKTTYTGDSKGYIGHTEPFRTFSTPMNIEGNKPKQGLDDMSPTPYTGSGQWQGIKEEKENDTGKVLPDADLDGLDGTVWRSDPDRTDDSGQFYGGILGDPLKKYPDSGGARPIDPIAAGLEAQSSQQASSDEQDNDESMQEPNESDYPDEDEPVQL